MISRIPLSKTSYVLLCMTLQIIGYNQVVYFNLTLIKAHKVNIRTNHSIFGSGPNLIWQIRTRMKTRDIRYKLRSKIKHKSLNLKFWYENPFSNKTKYFIVKI